MTNVIGDYRESKLWAVLSKPGSAEGVPDGYFVTTIQIIPRITSDQTDLETPLPDFIRATSEDNLYYKVAPVYRNLYRAVLPNGDYVADLPEDAINQSITGSEKN